MDVKCGSFTEMILLAGEWSERTGKFVLPADNPSSYPPEKGFTTADDEDFIHWFVPLRQMRQSCNFWANRLKDQSLRQLNQAILPFIHTDNGRSKLRSHVEACSICCVESVMSS